jgi:hypothetical protein
LETKITEYFNSLIKLAEANFENVTYKTDVTPQRAILRLNARYKQYRIAASELLHEEYRKYNYFLLELDFVVAGFDNAPDSRAIKMKYSKIPESDKDKLVPHLHLKNKTELFLTKEFYFNDFIEWINSNLNET